MRSPLILAADATGLTRAADALRRGLLVVLPTETLYGLAGDISISGVRERIFAAKGRPENKPLPIFAGNMEQVEACGGIFTPVAHRLAHRYWPGPLTLVLENAHRAMPIGFRVPDFPVALRLLEIYAQTVAVTSANRSGEPPAVTAQAAAEALGGHVEIILDAGPSPGGIPSTVVQCRPSGITILREGAIPTNDIQAVAAGDA